MKMENENVQQQQINKENVEQTTNNGKNKKKNAE